MFFLGFKHWVLFLILLFLSVSQLYAESQPPNSELRPIQRSELQTNSSVPKLKYSPTILTRLSDAARLELDSIELQKQGKVHEALSKYKEALELRVQVFGHDHGVLIEHLDYLAELSKAIHDYSLALNYFQRSQEIREKIYSTRDVRQMTGMNNLAEVYFMNANYSMWIFMRAKILFYYQRNRFLSVFD